MFCLLADIEIRKRTDNRLGLQDAMRGVIAAGGNHEQDWSIERVLATADKAVGVDVLTRLHNEMGPKPVTPDLAALWRDLGLRPQGESARIRRYRAAGGDPQGHHRAARVTLAASLAFGRAMSEYFQAYRGSRAGIDGADIASDDTAKTNWPVFRSLALVPRRATCRAI